MSDGKITGHFTTADIEGPATRDFCGAGQTMRIRIRAHHTICPYNDGVFSAVELRSMLHDARRRTLELVSDLSNNQLAVPERDILNPPVWEIGHIAWFQERWALRHLRGESPIHPHADQFWDSAAVSHDARWKLPLPSRTSTLQYGISLAIRGLKILCSPLSVCATG